MCGISNGTVHVLRAKYARIEPSLKHLACAKITLVLLHEHGYYIHSNLLGNNYRQCLPCVQGLHLCKMGTNLWEILLIRCFIRLSLTLWAAWKHLLDILIEIFLFQNTPLLLQIPILETLIKGAVFQSKAVLRELIYPEKIMS